MIVLERIRGLAPAPALAALTLEATTNEEATAEEATANNVDGEVGIIFFAI